MNKKDLKYQAHIIQIDHVEACISYYLVDCPTVCSRPRPPYGVLIEKEICGIVVDEYLALNHFDTEQEACSLLEDLARYLVTPMGACEAVKELINRS